MDVLLSQALDGFFIAKEAEGLSHHTLRNYRVCLRRFRRFLLERYNTDDMPVQDITLDHLRAFFVWLRHLHEEPLGIAPRPIKPLSDRTIHHHYVALSSFYTFLVRERIVEEHLMRYIPKPHFTEKPIEPLTRDEVAKLIRACRYTAPWSTKPTTQARRPTAIRDIAIIYLLLDTGMRASELCGLTLDDVNLRERWARARGKGRMQHGRERERIVPFSATTAKAIWKYLQQRPESALPYLFLTQDGRHLNRKRLRRLFKRLGERAGIPDVYPHRFRHTFAITYLRNEGDVFTLQRILGHSSLDMVQKYLRIAQADVETAHRKASPVENWGL